jgi:hypothetical protein
LRPQGGAPRAEICRERGRARSWHGSVCPQHLRRAARCQKYGPWKPTLQALRAAIANSLSKVELDRHSSELLGQVLRGAERADCSQASAQGAASNHVGRVNDVRLWHKADIGLDAEHVRS